MIFAPRSATTLFLHLSLSLSFTRSIAPFPFLRYTNRNFISATLKESIMSSLGTFIFVWHICIRAAIQFCLILCTVCTWFVFVCSCAAWFVCMQCAFRITWIITTSFHCNHVHVFVYIFFVQIVHPVHAFSSAHTITYNVFESAIVCTRACVCICMCASIK